MNKYRLGVRLSPEEWQRYRAEGYDTEIGRHAEKYFIAWEQKNISRADAIARLEEAYGVDPEKKEFNFLKHFSRVGLITDDHDLAADMIRMVDVDFVHDFKTDLFFMDVFALHELIMGYIYEAVFNETSTDMGVLAEKYLDKGMGCFNSSQTDKIYFGEDVMVPSFYNQFKNRVRRQ